jgi:hypothetical protein
MEEGEKGGMGERERIESALSPILPGSLSPLLHSN